MSLPEYLFKSQERILSIAPQQLFMWNRGYGKLTNEVVKELHNEFPRRNIQRDNVIGIMKEDPYKGFIAAMMWGGINVTQPKTKNGIDTPFWLLLNHPKNEVREAIEHAREQIIAGNFIDLFIEFSPGGKYKLPGVDSAYFTKLFYFLGQVEANKSALTPLIWDKWTSNAHCALLIQLLKPNDRLPYLGINRHVKYSVILPQAEAKAALYQQYISDFSYWAHELGTDPGKLEEFVFGKSLKEDSSDSNPRMELWAIIRAHLATESGSRENQQPNTNVGEPRTQNSRQQKTADEVRKGSKYYKLQEYFRGSAYTREKDVELSVDRIEEIIGSPLPNWAFTLKQSYWSNSGASDHVQKKAWLGQGYSVSSFSIDEEKRSGHVKFTLSVLKDRNL